MCSRVYFFIVVCAFLTCGVFAQQKPTPNSSTVIAVEKSLEFTNYTFEIVTIRDKKDAPTYKEFRASIKATDNLPTQAFWKLNATQASELLAYLKRFEELRGTETSKTGATSLTRIGRLGNTDLFFQLLPTTAAYLKVVDRTAPEINTRISYNDMQAMRRLLMEFMDKSED